MSMRGPPSSMAPRAVLPPSMMSESMVRLSQLQNEEKVKESAQRDRGRKGRRRGAHFMQPVPSIAVERVEPVMVRVARLVNAMALPP